MHEDYQLLLGDCTDILRTLDEKSVHCCVTSPPYFGLRDYGVGGQLGLEETPTQYVERLVGILRELRRVLRDDGTLWLNLGDSYARNPAKGQHKPGDPGKNAYIYERGNGRASATFLGEGLKEKDLIGIPWKVAFALQEDGWYLRQDLIWHKPNSIPESVRDRCTKCHEYIFLLSKSARYYYDRESIMEPEVCGRKRGPAEHPDTASTNGNSGLGRRESTGFRNRRSVWTVPTKPYRGAHFATFPPELIEPCILAGSPPGGTVIDPFAGSGTTAGVAILNGRKAILCELNPDYAALVSARVDEITASYERTGQVVTSSSRTKSSFSSFFSNTTNFAGSVT